MMKRITDPDFKYVPSHSTDIRKTFAKIRRELAKRTLPQGNLSVLQNSPERAMDPNLGSMIMTNTKV